MAKNLKAGPGGNSKTHDLSKYKILSWNDEKQIDEFVLTSLSEEENNRIKSYIKTLVADEALTLTAFEIKRIALAMIALDRGDDWFFKTTDDDRWGLLKIELQKFLHGKEEMIMKTLEKARERGGVKNKNLWDMIDDPSLKNIEIKAEGTVEGVDYVFEAKRKSKPKMIKVKIEGDEDGKKEERKEEE